MSRVKVSMPQLKPVMPFLALKVFQALQPSMIDDLPQRRLFRIAEREKKSFSG